MTPFVAQPTRRFVTLGLSALATAVSAAPANGAPPVVTILGDSITAGYGLAAADALPAQLRAALARQDVPARVRGAGVSGDTTAGALARVDFSVQSDTVVCVVELGGNDFLQSVSPAETERNLRAIIARLQRRRIAVVLATARLPAFAAGDYGREFAALYPRIARATGVALTPDLLAGVDRSSRQQDDLHPNTRGVHIIAERIAPVVVRFLRERSKPKS